MVAQGLAFVGGLGLAFRDLIEKNVGFVMRAAAVADVHESEDDTSSSKSMLWDRAVVYDHSLLGYQPVADCHDVTCQFCPEPDVFPPFDDPYHRVVKGIRAGHPYITGDLHNFRNVVLKLAQHCRRDATTSSTSASSTVLEQLTVQVRATQTADDLVRVLQHYASSSFSEVA